MNKYYTYPTINRWDAETWRTRGAVTDPLMDCLVPAVYDALYEKNAQTDRFLGRTDGIFDAKTNMYTFSDVVEKWESKGLHYHCTSMGFIAWMAIVPQTVIRGSAKNPQVLVVPHAADLKNPHWAMNTLEDMAAYNTLAAETETTMLYLVFGTPHSSGIYMDIMLELSAIFHIDMKHVWLDLTHLKSSGKTLADVPGLQPELLGEEAVIGTVPVVDITGRWVAKIGHQFICNTLNQRTEGFDSERLIHSTVGRHMADSMFMEQQYDSPDDPGLIAHWRKMGLRYDVHKTNGERWITFTPKSALEEPDKKIPILLILKEVREIAPFLTLTAFQFYHDFFEIAAQGECMMLFFAMETPDDNDMMMELLQEAAETYPVDLSRVYLIGQSHNGYFALEMARRHPDVITAVAQLNDRHYINSPLYSLDNIKMTDADIAEMAEHDMPLINICGSVENIFAHTDPDSENFIHDAEGFNRRLTAFRCPTRTLEEIMAAHTSSDKATRMNGFPADYTEVRYSMGTELYISNIKNVDDKWHLSLVSIENFPHIITPQMAELSWSFLRRFSRDPVTKEIVELY